MAVTTRGPAFYQPLQFHAFRMTSGISCTVVTGILVYFCYQLKTDGFKLPWTFLIVLLASILNLTILILTTCCSRFSPLLNVLINIPMLLLWIVAFSILTYNVYGLLAHSCSKTNWAISDGITICLVYKILFTFVVFSVLSHLGLVVMDVKARRAQVKAGKYNKMGSDTDIKMEPTNGLTGSADMATPMHGRDEVNEEHISSGWRPGAPSYDKKANVLVQEYALDSEPQYHHHQHPPQHHPQQYVEYQHNLHETTQQYPNHQEEMERQHFARHYDPRAPIHDQNAHVYHEERRY